MLGLISRAYFKVKLIFNKIKLKVSSNSNFSVVILSPSKLVFKHHAIKFFKLLFIISFKFVSLLLFNIAMLFRISYYHTIAEIKLFKLNFFLYLFYFGPAHDRSKNSKINTIIYLYHESLFEIFDLFSLFYKFFLNIFYLIFKFIINFFYILPLFLIAIFCLIYNFIEFIFIVFNLILCSSKNLFFFLFDLVKRVFSENIKDINFILNFISRYLNFIFRYLNFIYYYNYLNIIYFIKLKVEIILILSFISNVSSIIKFFKKIMVFEVCYLKNWCRKK